MTSLFTLILAALLPGAVNAETSLPANPNPIIAMGAYVPTDDIVVSEAFYSSLFATDPVIKLPDFVAFNVAGGWFAIVSKERYAPQSEPGTGAVPYLQSDDLEALQARLISRGGVASEIIEEPGIRLLKITDPNGQLIEFFTLTRQ